MSKTISINSNDLMEYVENKVKTILESDKFSSEGEPLDVDMNKMVDGAEKKPEAKVSATETKSASTSTDDPTEVDMNKMDKEQGSDGDIAAAVKVEAGGDLNSDQDTNVGMKKKDATSKTANPSKESGEPFDENGEAKMNSMDKEIDEGTKTYVEAGSEGVGSQPTTVGQKKAVAKEDAPASKETKPRIADAITMPEAKMTEKELINFAINEAKKIKDLL